MADKRVERVTAVEANLTSPSISLYIITETVAVGTPSELQLLQWKRAPHQ
jgi:hypothetical protein